MGRTPPQHGLPGLPSPEGMQAPHLGRPHDPLDEGAPGAIPHPTLGMVARPVEKLSRGILRGRGAPSPTGHTISRPHGPTHAPLSHHRPGGDPGWTGSSSPIPTYRCWTAPVMPSAGPRLRTISTPQTPLAPHVGATPRSRWRLRLGGSPHWTSHSGVLR